MSATGEDVFLPFAEKAEEFRKMDAEQPEDAKMESPDPSLLRNTSSKQSSNLEESKSGAGAAPADTSAIKSLNMDDIIAIAEAKANSYPWR